jgi:hypothetical protein
MAWSAYWGTLVPAWLAAPALAMWRLSRLGEGGGGSVSAGVSNWVANLSIAQNGASVWTGSASLFTIALWIVGPPLALWVAWIASRPPRREAGGLASGSHHAAHVPLPGPTSPVGSAVAGRADGHADDGLTAAGATSGGHRATPRRRP